MKEEVAIEKSSSMVVPVLISGVIGAGLALLLTPKSGSDIRHDIGRLARKKGEEAADVIEESKAAISEAVQTGQESISETTAQISEPAADRGKSLIVPILVSGVVGAAIALLFAPKPGKEVMEDIKDAASAAIDKGKSLYEQSAAAVKDAIEKGKEAAVEEKEKLRPAA